MPTRFSFIFRYLVPLYINIMEISNLLSIRVVLFASLLIFGN
ncbi:hypothetical protein BBUCA112A_H0011 (plasmid) [Borreliella burgdorferi CA-11.2A]|nr:hypothetical protein BBUCA112A_H0011 [Borreliella burgdorferi CA-11.2A]